MASGRHSTNSCLRLPLAPSIKRQHPPTPPVSQALERKSRPALRICYLSVWPYQFFFIHPHHATTHTTPHPVNRTSPFPRGEEQSHLLIFIINRNRRTEPNRIANHFSRSSRASFYARIVVNPSFLSLVALCVCARNSPRPCLLFSLLPSRATTIPLLPLRPPKEREPEIKARLLSRRSRTDLSSLHRT